MEPPIRFERMPAALQERYSTTELRGRVSEPIFKISVHHII